MKVVIADDHPLIADGIRASIEGQAEIEVVFVATSGKQVVDYVASHEVDLVLMDIEMPEMNGIDCSKLLRREFPHIRIIILSMYEEPTLIESFIEFGIKGYLLKTAPTKELLEAMVAVQEGKTYLSEEIKNSLNHNAKSNISPVPSFQSSKLAKRLSKREVEIVVLISKGYTTQQIADALFISVRTAETHRANILKKTKTKNVARLIRFAFQNGII